MIMSREEWLEKRKELHEKLHEFLESHVLPEPMTPAQWLLFREYYKDDEHIDVERYAIPLPPPSPQEAYLFVLTKMVLEGAAASLADHGVITEQGGKVDEIKPKVEAMEPKVTQLETDMNEIKPKVEAMEPKVTQLETDKATIEGRLGTLEGAGYQTSSDVTSAIEAAVSAAKTELEGKITAAKTELQEAIDKKQDKAG